MRPWIDDPPSGGPAIVNIALIVLMMWAAYTALDALPRLFPAGTAASGRAIWLSLRALIIILISIELYGTVNQ
jgi:hypothetical protein